MKGKFAGNLLRMLMAFFAGVIATLYILAPGDRKLSDLLGRREDPRHWANFSQAAGKVEQLGDKALACFFKAGDAVKTTPEKPVQAN